TLTTIWESPDSSFRRDALDLCCDVNEWLVFLPPCSGKIRAVTAIFVLRAHAARKTNSQVGLEIRFRRLRPGHRLIDIQRQRAIGAPAKSSLWRDWQMAGIVQLAAMASPHGHRAGQSPFYQMLRSGRRSAL
ncbi:hypothetical protein, partial [Ruegeria sp. HKCCD8929]|uniref:hypothetical protein n=1 Tax=Ruegeria sp. HKCCD8929 TaxID=2683006 RepID=UPI001C2BD1DF